MHNIWVNIILLTYLYLYIMQTLRCKLDQAGRILIPATFRKNLHVEPGDELMLQMQDNVISITTPLQALRKIQNKIQEHFKQRGEDFSLVDELIKERRKEAEKENE